MSEQDRLATLERLIGHLAAIQDGLVDELKSSHTSVRWAVRRLSILNIFATLSCLSVILRLWLEARPGGSFLIFLPALFGTIVYLVVLYWEDRRLDQPQQTITFTLTQKARDEYRAYRAGSKAQPPQDEGQ